MSDESRYDPVSYVLIHAALEKAEAEIAYARQGMKDHAAENVRLEAEVVRLRKRHRILEAAIARLADDLTAYRTGRAVVQFKESKADE